MSPVTSKSDRRNRPEKFRLPPDDSELMLGVRTAGDMVGYDERSLRFAIKDRDPKKRLKAFGGGHGKKLYIISRDLRLWLLSQKA